MSRITILARFEYEYECRPPRRTEYEYECRPPRRTEYENEKRTNQVVHRSRYRHR